MQEGVKARLFHVFYQMLELQFMIQWEVLITLDGDLDGVTVGVHLRSR